MTDVILIGAPIDHGQRRAGCVMGPAAYRVAGLAGAVRELGHAVQDWGDVALPELSAATCPNPAVRGAGDVLPRLRCGRIRGRSNPLCNL